jgi:hypothetical protein
VVNFETCGKLGSSRDGHVLQVPPSCDTIKCDTLHVPHFLTRSNLIRSRPSCTSFSRLFLSRCEAGQKHVEGFNLTIRCILGDMRLWDGDSSTSSWLVSLQPTLRRLLITRLSVIGGEVSRGEKMALRGVTQDLYLNTRPYSCLGTLKCSEFTRER